MFFMRASSRAEHYGTVTAKLFLRSTPSEDVCGSLFDVGDRSESCQWISCTYTFGFAYTPLEDKSAG